MSCIFVLRAQNKGGVQKDSAFVLPFWALLPTPPREAVGAGRLRPVSERQRTGRSGSSPRARQTAPSPEGNWISVTIFWKSRILIVAINERDIVVNRFL